MPYNDIDELAELVGDHGVLQTTLGELRSALGYDRLGKYVLGQIADELEGHNLGYFPITTLEDNGEPRQHHELRVYKRSSEHGKVIRAVTHPSPGGDQLLRSAVGASSEAVLDKIRALVCE